MIYWVDVVLSAKVDDEALHAIPIRANTYAVVETVEATRGTDGDDCVVAAQIDAPGPVAALGTLLTVLSQTSEHRLGRGRIATARRRRARRAVQFVVIFATLAEKAKIDAGR